MCGHRPKIGYERSPPTATVITGGPADASGHPPHSPVFSGVRFVRSRAWKVVQLGTGLIGEHDSGVVWVESLGAGVMSITATHLPTWAIVFCVAGSFLVVTIQTLVPQNSRDRLHWWRGLLSTARTPGPPGPPQ